MWVPAKLLPPERSKHFWVFALLLLALTTMGALLSLDLYKSYEQEFAIQRKDAANLSDVIERHIRASIDKIDVVLQEAVHGYTPVLSGTQKLAVTAANRDLFRREGAIPETQVRSLRVVDRDGNVVFSAGDTEELPKVNVGDRGYFLQQKNNPDAGLVMSEPILSRFTGQWLFTLSRRISLPDGSFAGLVQTAIRADHFQSGFQTLDVGTRGNVSLFSVVTAEFRLLARRPALPEQLGKPFELPEIRHAIQNGQTTGSYEATSRVDGVARHFTFRKFEGLPLVVTIGVTRNDFLKGWWQKAWLYGISFVLLALELIWLISHQRKIALDHQQLLEQKVLERTQELTEANEKLTAAMQAAESANIAKSQFLATMSHELRTPLNGILGMAQLIEMDGDDEALRKDFAQTIYQSGQTLLAVVNEILDLSKIEAGMLELQHNIGSPLEAVTELAALFTPLASKKGLTITVQTDVEEQALYQFDLIRLKQMLGNLLSNAVKFSERGSILLEARITAETSAHAMFRFSVKDQGIGIPEDKLPLLFKPFSQVDASVTRAYEGTGLGLSIVRKLAELMKGEAGVESEVGVGSTFWFTAQLQKEAPEDEAWQQG